jgi:predicted dithiol-disulfide oxidoreductase (DUF899 family)
MTDESTGATNTQSLPAAVDRATFQAELDRLRVREKAHTRESDAIAAARRRLPMVEVDAWTTLRGVEARDYSYALMDLTVYGRQEPWEDSPSDWPQQWQDGPTRRAAWKSRTRRPRTDATTSPRV